MVFLRRALFVLKAFGYNRMLCVFSKNINPKTFNFHAISVNSCVFSVDDF
jgi:hypothetical protein